MARYLSAVVSVSSLVLNATKVCSAVSVAVCHIVCMFVASYVRHIVCFAVIACHSWIQDVMNENSAGEILMPDNNIE